MTAVPSPADLDRWEALAAAATTGWYASGIDVFRDRGAFLGQNDIPLTEADAAFIAEARQAVPVLVAALRDALAEVERWEARYPCDSYCTAEPYDGPHEDCSRHGRTPDDLWGMLARLNAERDALAAEVEHPTSPTLARARVLIEADLRERLAAEIEAQSAPGDDLDRMAGYEEGRDDAACIVRGGK